MSKVLGAFAVSVLIVGSLAADCDDDPGNLLAGINCAFDLGITGWTGLDGQLDYYNGGRLSVGWICSCLRQRASRVVCHAHRRVLRNPTVRVVLVWGLGQARADERPQHSVRGEVPGLRQQRMHG